MQATYVQRLRLTFTKTGPTRFIGHLDLALTLERALNRAKIPMDYSHGFNRRPRMQLAAALPLGFTSAYELADIWLREVMEPADLQARLMAKMAPGIEILQVEEVPLKAPALQTITIASTYVVTVLDPVDMDELQEKVTAMLAAESLMRERGKGRKRKAYDLRPLIHHLALSQNEEGLPQLDMTLSLQPGAAGRPDEVVAELGLDPLAARVHRTHILLQED
ncbi:MAG: hypothetical protein Kow0080_16700 [Candidatus Promineifilaceae bacterium]